MTKNAKPGEDLFAYLRRKTGAPNISDLHEPPYHEEAVWLCAQENAKDHPLTVWNDVLAYLLKHAACATADAAKQIFVRAAQAARRRRANG